MVSQHGFVEEQLCPASAHWVEVALPHVPLVEPAGKLQTSGEQQSPSAVQVPPAPRHETQVLVVPSHLPEQHWYAADVLHAEPVAVQFGTSQTPDAQ